MSISLELSATLVMSVLCTIAYLLLRDIGTNKKDNTKYRRDKMSLHDNYPSDVRNYDSDPRSPFYVPKDVECTNPKCSNVQSEEDVDEDGRCYEECEIRYCKICGDDVENCLNCED